MVPSLINIGVDGYLRVNIGGRMATTTVARIRGNQADVVWNDNLVVPTTARGLFEQPMEICLFLQLAFQGGARDMLAGRVRLWCPRALATFPQEACISTGLWHGNTSHPMSVISFLMNVIEWSPHMDYAVTHAGGSRICLDVFDEEDDSSAAHLGRLVLSSSKIQKLATMLSPWVENKFSATAPRQGLPLRSWSARNVETTAKNIGMIFITLTARNLALLCSPRVSYVRRGTPPRENVIGQLIADKKSIDAAEDTIDLLVDRAWKFALTGRHAILHIVDATGLCAWRARNDCISDVMGSVEVGGETSPRIPDAYCVVHRNSVELGRTRICPREISPSWNDSIRLAPPHDHINSETSAIVIDVYDDFPNHELELEALFLGRTTLSYDQVWELRQITRRRLREQEIFPCGQPFCAATKVDYKLSWRKIEPQSPDTADTSSTIRRAVLSMTHMAAAELPGTTLSSRLFGHLSSARQSSYVVLRLPGTEARSSMAKFAGARALWKHDCISIDVDESLLAEEPLLVQVWGKKSRSRPDYLIGEGYTRLEAVIGSKGNPIPITLELGRPGYRQQGILSCSLSLDQQEKMSNVILATPRDSDSSEHQTAAIGLAATVDADAETASTTFSRDTCVRQSELYNMMATMAMPDATSRLVARLEASELDGSYSIDNSVSALSSRADSRIVSCRQDEQRYSGGIDAATSLPWRKDHLGYRRFFLGFATR
mmetsp:Transcript_14812/g.45949  ORF Transcript_14812/g.45949 Transcript_14812/m.45949 type:complete len:717 (+) Transcript_14812:2601-4751(+)